MRVFDFDGGVAVVTGAASGIGESVARGLARRGSHLVLLDRDGPRLDAVATSLRTGQSTVETHVVDLADADATAEVARAVLAAHPRVRLLVNNAGVALAGRFDQVALDEFLWVIDVNFRATVQLSHAFLPALRAEPGSHLVNVSSLFGLIAPAGQAAYAASKFAVRGFTEALRSELDIIGIGVTCVHPGGIRTRIAESARYGRDLPDGERERHLALSRRVLTMDPARAAEIILRGVRRRRPRVLIGGSAKALDVVARVLPGSYPRLIRAATRGRLDPPVTR